MSDKENKTSPEEPMVAKKDKTKERVGTVIFMLAVTFVFISVLSFIYLFTRKTVQRNDTLYLKRAVLYTAGIETPKDDKAVEELFARRIQEVKGKDDATLYYKILGGPDPAEGVKGFIFPENGSGLWGTITALVGLSQDLKTVIGVDFVKDNETPGLGARINEKWFREQFRGKEGKLSPVPEKSEADRDQFQAITGATITSTAVQKIINDTQKKAPELIKR